MISLFRKVYSDYTKTYIYTKKDILGSIIISNNVDLFTSVVVFESLLFISLSLLLLCHSKLDIDYLYMAYADIMAKVRPFCLMVNC